jgi:predicted metal-dependent hydrolase
MAVTTLGDYHPLYLAGVQFFNAGDYFEAHEAWEELWQETAGPDRRFYQGLIQTAVGLLHFCNGNLRGALSLYRSSQDYLRPFQPQYLGVNLAAFSEQLAACFAALLSSSALTDSIEFPANLAPVIELFPPPPVWPTDPYALLPNSDH